MLIASLIFPATLNLSVSRGDYRLRLRDDGLLQMASRCQIRESSLLRSYGSNCSGARGNVVAIIQLHENIAGMHRLVVCNSHAGDEAADLRCDNGYVAADVSIIGALHESPNRPP